MFIDLDMTEEGSATPPSRIEYAEEVGEQLRVFAENVESTLGSSREVALAKTKLDEARLWIQEAAK